MATKNDTTDVNDFVSSFTRKRSTASSAEEASQPVASETESETLTAADSTPEPVAPSAPVERQTTGQKQTGKKEQPAELNYADTFLGSVRSRKGKAVYVDEDTHNALSVITQASDGTPLADLIINIVNHHFETYGPNIRAFLNDQEKKNKKRLPY